MSARADVILYRMTPGGVYWVSSVTTQVENLTLLQLASLFGSSAVSFTLAWVASSG